MSNVHIPARAAGEKSPVGLELAVAGLLGLDMYLALALGMRDGLKGAELFGYATAPVFIILVVIGIARLIGKAKTRRARAVIALWTLLLMLFAHCGNLGKTKEPAAQSLRTATRTPA